MTWLPRNLPVPEAYLVCLAAGLTMHRIRRWRLTLSDPPRHLLAWPFVITGVHLVTGAVRAAGTVDLDHPRRLVTSGPYARSRNPMYAGWALASLGTGVLTRSGWIAAAVPFAAAWTHLDVLREERRLAALFGADFETYRAGVPRYLGQKRYVRP